MLSIRVVNAVVIVIALFVLTVAGTENPLTLIAWLLALIAINTAALVKFQPATSVPRADLVESPAVLDESRSALLATEMERIIHGPGGASKAR